MSKNLSENQLFTMVLVTLVFLNLIYIKYNCSLKTSQRTPRRSIIANCQ
jgi:hypothetical protein